MAPLGLRSQRVMSEFQLGPNGGMLYCLEYLEQNVDWLLERVHQLRHKYLIFDLPGQVTRLVGVVVAAARAIYRSLGVLVRRQRASVIKLKES